MKFLQDYREIIATIGLFIILGIIWNLNDFYYSDMLLASIVTVFIILIIFTSIILVKDKPADEREEHHHYIANQSAFIAGTTVISVALVIQAINHTVDQWLIITLIVMILTKLIVRKRFQNCC
jgi:hypothetical protein